MTRNLGIFSAIERDLLQQKARLMGKVPDIKKSLSIVELLQKKQEAGQKVGTDACQELACTPGEIAAVCS